MDTESFRRRLLPMRSRLTRVRLDRIAFRMPVFYELPPSFWTSTPLMLLPEIRVWIEARGDLTWPRWRSPRFKAELVAGDGEYQPTIRVMRRL